jgi:ribonuclease Z
VGIFLFLSIPNPSMMTDFKVTILGNGSAVPTGHHNPSSQIVKMADMQLMIDCGEGTQMQMIKYSVKHRNLNHIFISHLHGDHYFGIFGLISTFHLFGRDTPLNLYAPAELKKLIEHQLRISNTTLRFSLNFYPLEEVGSMPLFVYKNFTASIFPLFHRIPTWGIKISMKDEELRIDKGFVESFNPTIEQILKIKKGEDFTSEKGILFKNEEITLPPKPALSYAYCSDTAFNESLIQHLKNANLVYHEATFDNTLEEMANDKQHSTSEQAARLAKLSKVGRLLLGHYSARFEDLSELLAQAQSIFPKTLLSEEGKSYEIGS